MKRFLLWLVGVVLGVGVFLGAVMGVSYAFTTEGGCPDSTAQFGTEALEPNGWCWQVPLIGGKLDKVFASPATLTVQKRAHCTRPTRPSPCRTGPATPPSPSRTPMAALYLWAV